jgi:hypothetical protein
MKRLPILTRPAEALLVSKLSRPRLSRRPKCARTGGNIGRGSGAGRPAPLPLPVFPSCGPLSRTRQLLPMRNQAKSGISPRCLQARCPILTHPLQNNSLSFINSGNRVCRIMKAIQEVENKSNCDDNAYKQDLAVHLSSAPPLRSCRCRVPGVIIRWKGGCKYKDLMKFWLKSR